MRLPLWIMTLLTSSAMMVPAGTLTSAVGSGAQGYAGDGGPATQALLDQPFQCSKDRRGHLYVADTFNHCIRRIDAKSGVITTVAGCGKKGYTGDGGPAAQATLNEPYGVLPDRDGNLYIVDRLNAAIRRVDAKSGIITTYAGNGTPGYSGDGGPASRAAMKEPNALDFDPEGNLYVADVTDCRIRKIDRKTGVITTACGTGRREFAGDGGNAAQASIHGARGVAFDRQGNMYICEREGNRIRRVDAKTGIIRTIAGAGKPGYTGDGGPALQATFNGPKWIHVGADGNVYVVDTENHCVRRIDPRTGVITTAAGGRKGPDGDGGAATAAGMDRPHGCWVDNDRRLYTADTNNHRVRVVQLPEQ
jgi:streptogramin lyase